MISTPARHLLAAPVQEIFVPEDSPVFVQMPGDHVLTGILRYKNDFPSWLKPSHQQFTTSERVYLYVPEGFTTDYFYGLSANLETTLHQKNNTNFQEYNCFIKTNKFVLKAHLLGPSVKIDRPTKPHVYVQMPGDNFIYGGQLKHLAQQNIPEWIR